MAVKYRQKDRGHQIYRLRDGTRVKGASTITGALGFTKNVMIAWANRLGREGVNTKNYVDGLADAGTLAHYLVECDMAGMERDQGYLDEFSKVDMDRALVSFEKYRDWRAQHDVQCVWHEQQLVSEIYRFGGTLDILAYVDGLLVLVDIKTCKALYGATDEKWTQVAGYDLLCKETLGLEPDECRILRIGRNEQEGFEYALMPRRDWHRERFLTCVKLWQIEDMLKGKTRE